MSSTDSSPGRLLVANLGLDGRDRGLKVVARVLRDAGFEVIYTGLFQNPTAVAAAAVDEDVDAVGLSMVAGAQVELVALVTHEMQRLGADIPVFVVGVVPADDVARLLAAGVVAVLAPETSAAEMVAQLSTILALRGFFRGGNLGALG
ncbi:MAG: cobalamin-dependent protein [Ilumatobacteraceae bacterium]